VFVLMVGPDYLSLATDSFGVTLMKFLTGFLSALVLLVIAGAAYVYTGMFDVAASSPHNEFERLILNATMAHSVVARAARVEAPQTFTDEIVRDGFEHYDEMCTVCHAGPGIERSEISKGLNPPAPDLAQAVKDWTPRQLFWIVNNGVKMTGMPSFGMTHDENEIWSIVAFIEKLPGMTAEQYQQIKQRDGPDTHEHMMQH
jgi:mono/diheme cytochrome c family protein